MPHNELTSEQLKKIEENRRRALELRAAKSKAQSKAQSNAPAPSQALAHVSLNSHLKSQAPHQNHHKSGPLYSSLSRPSSSNHVRPQAVSSKKFFGGKEQQNPLSASRPISSSQEDKKATLSIISRDRFELQMTYHQQTVDLVRGIEGRQYNQESKRWNFPITQHSKVVAILKTVPNVLVEELPKLIINTFMKPSGGPSPKEVDLSCIQPCLLATLKEFQLDGVRFAVSKGGRVLIADDMGLGKTIQALAIADYYHKEWPLLIVCPSSMRFQWLEEIYKHLRNVHRNKVVVVTNSKESISHEAHIIIISYDLMTTCKSELMSKKFGVIIMDESHHLKNKKTKRTQVGTDLLKKSTRCILLTGTPVLSRPQELFCQLHAINPTVFHSFFDFGIRYCDGKQEKFGWNFNGSSNMAELRLLLLELVMIRRLKSEVLSQLPPKQREVVIIESAGPKLGDTSEFAKILQKEGLNGMKKHSTLLQYFHETGLAKIKGIVQYIENMIENGEKFLVFAHHAHVLDAICKAVEDKKTDYIRIDGAVTSDVRKLMCNHFQESESCLVAVLSIKAANTGLTLTAAHLVVFAELYWNPAELTQGEDRVHRIGQEDSVLVQYLVQHGTADDIMWPMIQKKLNVLSKAGLSSTDFMDAETRVLKDRSKTDIKDYFQSSDDTELAGIDLSEFDEDLLPPESKKPKCS